MNSINCIGVTGMNGAGKTELSTILCSHFFVGHYEVRKFLEKECERRGVLTDRDSLVFVANDLREHYDPDYIMKQLVAEAVNIRGLNPFLIESIRCVGEVEYLSKTFGEKFVLLGVDAPIETRYKRTQCRDSDTDRVTFEKFCKQEQFEMEQQDPWKQNLSGCMRLVRKEFLVWNESDDKHKLFNIAQKVGKSLGLSQ